ncbi:MAG: transcription antitermination factor NusB [Spirochaetota bacterium]
MGARRQGRIIAFQAIFSWEMNKIEPDELTQFRWLDADRRREIKPETLDFARLLTIGSIENIETIDDCIKNHLENWDFERLSKVDLAILRISVFSLLRQKDIPFSVTIDEAVDISKEFGNDDSYRFVNGVLDGIRKHLDS